MLSSIIYLVVGLMKRLNDCHPAEDVVEINSHVDGILKRFTSVDALVNGILRRNPSNQASAQAVFTPDLIVDDCDPAGDVFTHVDAFCQQADVPIDSPSIEINKHHAAGEPGPRVEIDDCYPRPASGVVTSVNDVVPPSDVRLKPLFIDVKYLLGDIEHLQVEYLRYNIKHCTRFKRRVFTSVDERPHVDHLRYNFSSEVLIPPELKIPHQRHCSGGLLSWNASWRSLGSVQKTSITWMRVHLQSGKSKQHKESLMLAFARSFKRNLVVMSG